MFFSPQRCDSNEAAPRPARNLPQTVADRIQSVHSRRPAMKYRRYRNSDLEVSEVGFGLWTVSTGWWGQFTENEALSLLHKAFDQGITLFDAADTYGNGYSEELLAKAFAGRRDQVVIATKIGYDFVNHGTERRGQR